jgi:hypothetical protein
LIIGILSIDYGIGLNSKIIETPCIGTYKGSDFLQANEYFFHEILSL